MTIWAPKLTQNDTPIYRRIADQLERDIAGGVLLPGSRLPTHRDLASRLGITVVTVTRAYAEATDRGLIESSVGRGSFVRARRKTAAAAREIDLATNVVSGEFEPAETLAQRIVSLISTSYGVGAGSERHRSAGATWIAGARPDAAPSRIVVTAGAQHAILLGLSALTRPGDTVLGEAVTYHGARGAAAMLHLKFEPLPLDRYGLSAEALERAAKKKQGKVLYVTPTLQNPTGTVMPEKRRRELAAIAEQYGITIIEDDVYGFLVADAPPAITSFAPDRGIFISGIGKAISPALRIGYLLAPEPLVPKLTSMMAASTLFASPLGAEVAATAIEDGSATRAVAQKRETIAVRQRIARRVLGERAIGGDARSPHVWLDLPQRWTPDAFADEIRRRNVRVTPASVFAVGAEAPRAIRISLGAPATAADVEHGLDIVAALREQGAHAAHRPVV